MSSKIKHIAVMRLSSMGDVAMTVPVLTAFAQQYPQIKITMVSRPFFKPLFEGIPNLSFLAFDEKNRHKGSLGLLRLYKDLRALKIDAMADLHNVLRSKVVRTLFAMSGKAVAFVDKGRKEKKELTRELNKVFKPLRTMFQRHSMVFEQLGFPVDLNRVVLAKRPIIDPQIQDLIGNSIQKLIGIAPFAQYDLKVYPLDLMQQVIDVLSENKDFKILLFGGGKRETELLESLAQKRENIVVVAGRVKFEQELQLISKLDVMLSMDSGNAHIAAMLGVKVVSLWGATHPYAGFYPFNQSMENAILSDRNKFPKLPTSVYGNKKIEGYDDVMRSIPPQTVIDKIYSLI